MKPYYDDGTCMIFHGDARELLPGFTADVVITDPPYGVGVRYGEQYEDTEAGYREWMLPVFEEMRQAAPLVLLTPGVRNLWMYPPPTWALCWAKPGSTRRSDLGGFNNWEPVLVYGKRRIYQDLVNLPTAPNVARLGTTGDHPCPKPLKLLTWLVEQASDPDQVILDPFMGSGTTLRAAKDLGRQAIGFEIEERYCYLAAQRLGQEVLNLA